MNIIKVCKAVEFRIKHLKEIQYAKQVKHQQNNNIINRGDAKRLFLFCAPRHSNLGDQAQLLCWLRLFAKWYPDYEILQVSTNCREFATIRNIRKTLRPDDKIFIHSGYLIFDPHPELPFILDVVRAFYDHPVTILPQTVNITTPWMQEVIGRELDMHTNLTLMCRDEVSLERAKALFKNVHLQLMPDVVTSLIGDKDFSQQNNNRKGVMFCLRDDLEKHYSDEDLATLMAQFNFTKVGRRDTTIVAKAWEWDQNRKGLILDIIKELSTYEVVITDRYHGTILSAIANTPVIVINSADHKLSSGVRWFNKDAFGNAVQFAPTLDDAATMAKEILNNKVMIQNPSYFSEKYWSEVLVLK